MRSVDHLLIGGGIASATCARTLREHGADGSVLLVGRELDAPYHRPPITKDSVLQLIGARLLIEPAVAAQAARAAGAAEVAGAARSLDRLEAAVTNALTPPGGPAFALNFHVELAAASGNPVVEELLASLLKVRVREQQQIRQLYDNRNRDYEEHRAIFEAVRAGDATAAETLTRQHLDHIRTAVEAADFPADPR